MIRSVRFLAILAVSGIAACASAPTRFYTLLPQSSPARSASSAEYRINVLPVRIPAQDDQPQLVVRESEDRVALLEGERWVAPLGDQIRAAVSEGLARDLGAVDVHGLPASGPQRVYRVKLDVRRFESVPGRYAREDIVWSVHEADAAHAALTCASSLTEPVGSGYAALVRGHQQALAALSGRIAGALRAVAAGRAVACP
jgi:hypothetical protein